MVPRLAPQKQNKVVVMKRRREAAPARRGKRSQLRTRPLLAACCSIKYRCRLLCCAMAGHVQSEDEGSDSSTVSESEAPTPTLGAVQRDARRNEGGEEDEEDEEEEEDGLLDFTQTDYATQQLSQAVGPGPAEEREAAKAKAPSVPARIAQLSDKVGDTC